jgi:hypothetical protein
VRVHGHARRLGRRLHLLDLGAGTAGREA